VGALAVLDYRLLGPIEAGVDGRLLEIGGRKQRALLAILLLNANEPVSRDCLAERLWGEHPPAGAQHTLEVYVSRLRKALGPAAGCEVVLTRPGAYLLQTADDRYYGGSAPPQAGRPTAGPARARALAARGRADRDGSRVHCDSLGEGGAQLCPCGIATATPQHFRRGLPADTRKPAQEFPVPRP
jgi:hypothetical protein